jgi:hypothetical protein
VKRRSLLAGLGAALLAAGGAWRFHLFGRHFAPTAYDDLLDQITDREPASLFGKEALRAMPGITAAGLAGQLRHDPANLSVRARGEPGRNRVTEVGGWVVPESVARYAALAASV